MRGERQGSAKRTSDWTREEVAAAVSDYMRMLRMELSGQNYNKSAHRRELLRRLNGRNEASVELKHRNISAVLIRLGVMPIRGYKALFNYQGLLFDEVERALCADTSLDSIALLAVTQLAEKPMMESFEDFVSAPPVLGRRVREEPVGWDEGIATQRDYLEREARNKSLGLAGEQTVLEYEVLRLRGEGRPRLADKIEHCSRTRGDGLGFDIMSYDSDGRERFIEVKTTAFSAETPFFISEGERAFSSRHPDQFHLYRLFEFRDRPRMYTLRGEVERSCQLDPISYRALPAGRE